LDEKNKNKMERRIERLRQIDCAICQWQIGYDAEKAINETA
jgi:hypothetical protein